MRLTLDTGQATLTIEGPDGRKEFALYSPEAFQAISREWVRTGWALQYYFTFTWAGRPMLQLPEDVIRLQEVLYHLQPDVILETGVYAGGSLLFHSTICEAAGKGRVIGIDKHIDAEVRSAIESNRLAGRITLIEGDSVSPEVVARARSLIQPQDSVLVILDSHHAYAHVAAELEAYSSLVTPGSYILVADGIMRDLAGVPGGDDAWVSDNPACAAAHFLERHPEFEKAPPPWRFNRSSLKENITYWPDGWLRRKA